MLRSRKLRNHPDALDIDVSGDGACLFYSIAFSVLIPVVDNKDKFNKAYTTLFGKAASEDVENARQLLLNYDGTKNFISSTKAQALKHAINTTFRNRIVDHMTAHKEQGVLGENDRGFQDFSDEQVEPFKKICIIPIGSQVIPEQVVPGVLYIQLNKNSAFYYAVDSSHSALKSGIELNNKEYNDLNAVLSTYLPEMLQPKGDPLTISDSRLVTEIRKTCGISLVVASFEAQMQSMRDSFKAGSDREITAAADILAPLGIDIVVHTFTQDQAVEHVYRKGPQASPRAIHLIHDTNSDRSTTANHYRYFIDKSYLIISRVVRNLQQYQPANEKENTQKQELIEAFEKNRDATSDGHIDDAKLYLLVLIQLCESDDNSNDYRAVLFDILKFLAGKLTDNRKLIRRINETIGSLEKTFTSGYAKPQDSDLAIFNEVLGPKATQAVPVNKPENKKNSEKASKPTTTSPIPVPEMKRNPINPQEAEARKELGNTITGVLQQFRKDCEAEKIDTILQMIDVLISVTRNYCSPLLHTLISQEDLLAQFKIQLNIINGDSFKEKIAKKIDALDVLEKFIPYKTKTKFIALLENIVSGIEQNKPELIRMPDSPQESASSSPLSQSSESLSQQEPKISDIKKLRLPKFFDTTYDVPALEEINARHEIVERNKKLREAKNIPAAVNRAISNIVCDYNYTASDLIKHDVEEIKNSLTKLPGHLKSESDHVNLGIEIKNIEKAKDRVAFIKAIHSINRIAKSIKESEQADRSRFNQVSPLLRYTDNKEAVDALENSKARYSVRATVDSLLRSYKPEQHRAVDGIGKTCEAISLSLLWPQEKTTKSSRKMLELTRREYSADLIASERDDTQKQYLEVVTAVFEQVTEYVKKRKASFLFRWMDDAREGQIKRLFEALSAFMDKKQRVTVDTLEACFQKLLREIEAEFKFTSPTRSDLYKIINNANNHIKMIKSKKVKEIITDNKNINKVDINKSEDDENAIQCIIHDYETGLNSAANIGTKYAAAKVHVDPHSNLHSTAEVYTEEGDLIKSASKSQIERDIHLATRSIDKTKNSKSRTLRDNMTRVLTIHLQECDLVALANILQTNLVDGLHDILTDTGSNNRVTIETTIKNRLKYLIEDLLLSDMHSVDDQDINYDNRLDNCYYRNEIYQLNKAAIKINNFPLIQKLPKNSAIRAEIDKILEEKANELLINICNSLLSKQSHQALYEHDLKTYYALINHSINPVFVLKAKNGSIETAYPKNTDEKLKGKLNEVHKRYLTLLSESTNLELFNTHMFHVAETNMAVISKGLKTQNQPLECDVTPESTSTADHIQNANEREILRLNSEVRDRHIYLLLSSGKSTVSEILEILQAYSGPNARPSEVMHVFNQALNDFCLFHNYDYLQALGKEKTINDEEQRKRTKDLSSLHPSHPFLYTCDTKDKNAVAAVVNKVHILLSFQKYCYSKLNSNNQDIEIFLGTYFSFLMRIGNEALIESEIRKLNEKGFTSIINNSLSGKVSFNWTNLFNDELNKLLTSVPVHLTENDSQAATARTIAYMFCSANEQNKLEGAIQYRNALFSYINNTQVQPITVNLSQQMTDSIASSLSIAVKQLINTLVAENKIEQLNQIISLKSNKDAGYDSNACLSYVYDALLINKNTISNEMYSAIANHPDFRHYMSGNQFDFDLELLHSLYNHAGLEAKPDLLNIAIARLDGHLINDNYKHPDELFHGYQWLFETNYQSASLKTHDTSWDKLFGELHNRYVHANTLEEQAMIREQLDFITQVYCSDSSKIIFNSTIQSNLNVENFMSLLTPEFLSSKSHQFNASLVNLTQDLMNCDDIHRTQLSKYLSNQFDDVSIKYNVLCSGYMNLHYDNGITNEKGLLPSDYNEADIRQVTNLTNLYLKLKSAGSDVPVADGFIKCIEEATQAEIIPQLYNGSIFFSGTSQTDSIYNLDVSKRKIYEQYLLLTSVIFKTCNPDSSVIDVGLNCVRSAYIAHGAAGLSVTEEMDKFRYDALEQFSSYSDIFPSSFMGHHTFTTNSRNSNLDSEFRKICRKEYANESIFMRILKNYYSLLKAIQFNATQGQNLDAEELCTGELYLISGILLELRDQSTITHSDALFKNLQFCIQEFLKKSEANTFLGKYTNSINSLLSQLDLGNQAYNTATEIDKLSPQSYTYLDKQYYILNLLTQDKSPICLAQRMKLAHAELISLIEVNAQFNPKVLHAITESIGIQYACSSPVEIANHLSSYMMDEANTDILIKTIQSMTPVNIFTKMQDSLEGYLKSQSRTKTNYVSDKEPTYINIINTHLMSEHSDSYEQALNEFNCIDFGALNHSTLQDLNKYALSYNDPNVPIKYMISALLYTHLSKMIDAQKKPGIKSLQASLISVSNIIELMNLIDIQLNFIKKSGVQSSEFVKLLRHFYSICSNELSALSELPSGDLNPFKNTIALINLNKHLTSIVDYARFVNAMSHESNMMNELMESKEFIQSFQYCLSLNWKHLTPVLQQYLIGISKRLLQGLAEAGCNDIATMIKAVFFTKNLSETQMRILAAIDRKVFIDILIMTFDIDKDQDLARCLMPINPNEIDYILYHANANLSARLFMLAAISRKHFFQALPSIQENDSLIHCINVIKDYILNTPQATLESFEFKVLVNLIIQRSGGNIAMLCKQFEILGDRTSYFNLCSYIKNSKDLNTFLECAQRFTPITQDEFNKINPKLFADAELNTLLNLHRLLSHPSQNGNVKLDGAVKIYLHGAAQKIYADDDKPSQRQLFINTLLQKENAVSYFLLYYPYGQIHKIENTEEKVRAITDLIKNNRYYLSASQCKIIFDSLPNKAKICEFVCKEFLHPSGGFARTDSKMVEIMKNLLVTISTLSETPLFVKPYHYDKAIECLTKRLELCVPSDKMSTNAALHTPQNEVGIDANNSHKAFNFQ